MATNSLPLLPGEVGSVSPFPELWLAFGCFDRQSTAEVMLQGLGPASGGFPASPFPLGTLNPHHTSPVPLPETPRLQGKGKAPSQVQSVSHLRQDTAHVRKIISDGPAPPSRRLHPTR